jgi:hypothetical protein
LIVILAVISTYADAPICDLCLDQDYVMTYFGGDEDACLEANCLEIPINTNNWVLVMMGGVLMSASYIIYKKQNKPQKL